MFNLLYLCYPLTYPYCRSIYFPHTMNYIHKSRSMLLVFHEKIMQKFLSIKMEPRLGFFLSLYALILKTLQIFQAPHHARSALLLCWHFLQTPINKFPSPVPVDMPVHDLDVSEPGKICMIPPDGGLYFHVQGKLSLILHKIPDTTKNW